MPFLRLTRDRRGFENTFLMHADRPGDRPRLLYWYRTAPGIALGRSPLDEDAIRTIEDQHPDIDFDWPAILALAEVMTPEDEAPARAQQPTAAGTPSAKSRSETAAIAPPGNANPRTNASSPKHARAARRRASGGGARRARTAAVEMPPPSNRLVEELAGREIGSRLRARHAEIIARIDDLDVDGSVKDAWFKRAEAIDPELWMTPEEVLDGVRNADAHYDKLRAELAAP